MSLIRRRTANTLKAVRTDEISSLMANVLSQMIKIHLIFVSLTPSFSDVDADATVKFLLGTLLLQVSIGRSSKYWNRLP